MIWLRVVFLKTHHHHHHLPSPHGILAAVNLHSALFLAFVVQSAKLVPVHLMMLSTHPCRCCSRVLVHLILPSRRLFSIVCPEYLSCLNRISYFFFTLSLYRDISLCLYFFFISEEKALWYLNASILCEFYGDKQSLLTWTRQWCLLISGNIWCYWFQFQ